MCSIKITRAKNEISNCKEFIQTLNGQIFENQKIVTSWFEKLCEHLTKAILQISEVNKELKLDKGNRDTLLLYLRQILTLLSLIINTFVTETDIQQTVNEARLCSKKQVLWCLDGLEETLISNKSILDPSGSFIKWMDSALDKIAEVEVDKDRDAIIVTINEAKVLFEEVLSHAMSIAQVALKDDCKIIRGSSQTVLESLDTLTQEINKDMPNSALVNLFVDTCTDKLCALERRVNTAVLKLCLKVFSEYTSTLEIIHDFCFNEENKNNIENLDLLVADFDLHVDRIMQIGLFAVSCSTDTSRGINIRSCLASLEALECELVPAYTSVLLDKSIQNVNLTLLLKNHWLQQAIMLRKLIYLIIDPFAFCQVIFEENKQTIDSISETILKSKASLLDKNRLKPVIDQSNILQDFINVVIKEEQDEEIDKNKLMEHFVNFKNVLHEIQSASDVLLKETNRQEYHKNNLRILKRCKILLTTTKKLWNGFVEEDKENKNNSDIELQVSNVSNKSEKQPTGNPFLDHIINRGKQILKDRSVLYRTSLKSDSIAQVPAFRRLVKLKEENKSVPLSKLVHLRKVSFMNSNTKNDSLDELQLTDILNELKNMTDTF